MGGVWLLDTIGGAIESKGRSGDSGLIAVVWVSVVLKLIASAAGPTQFHEIERIPRRASRFIGWTAGSILYTYGLVLTTAGLLVETDVIATDAGTNHHAMRWHAFFWDPWFLLWGACLLAAMKTSRGVLKRPRGEDLPV